MNIGGLFTVGVALVAVAWAAGCVDQKEGAIFPQQPPGTLTLAWTVGGEATPEACAALGAERIEIAVLVDGERIYDVDAPCERFSLGIELPEADYDVVAVLVDEAGRPRSAAYEAQGVSMVNDQDLLLPVDF